MPFRSEKLVVAEKVRRAEEVAAELLERQNELRVRLTQRGRQRNAWLLLFTGVVVAGGVGWGGGSLAAEARAKRIRASIESEEQGELSREHSAVVECQAATDRSTSDLRACQRSLADRVRATTAPRSATTACSCLDGDLLCQCAFDRTVAATVLTAAQSPVRMCFVPARPVTFHTRITFAARTGEVERAVIDTSDGNLSEMDRACVLAVLQKVKVPPFGGSAVTVGKAFSVRAP